LHNALILQGDEWITESQSVLSTFNSEPDSLDNTKSEAEEKRFQLMAHVDKFYT